MSPASTGACFPYLSLAESPDWSPGSPPAPTLPIFLDRAQHSYSSLGKRADRPATRPGPGHLAHGKALPPRSGAARSDARTALLDERVLYLFAVFFVLALTINLLSGSHPFYQSTSAHLAACDGHLSHSCRACRPCGAAARRSACRPIRQNATSLAGAGMTAVALEPDACLHSLAGGTCSALRGVRDLR